jgi:hypothetical protein
VDHVRSRALARRVRHEPQSAMARRFVCKAPTAICEYQSGIQALRSLPCTADGDCVSGMVCFAQTTDNCAGTTVAEPACSPGQKCAEPCAYVETVHHGDDAILRPQVPAPCKTASDCGAGFMCAPDEVGSCSGGGSAHSDCGAPASVDGGPPSSNCEPWLEPCSRLRQFTPRSIRGLADEVARRAVVADPDVFG